MDSGHALERGTRQGDEPPVAGWNAEELPSCDGDPDQKGNDGLGHRKGREPMLVGSLVLIPLDKNGITLRYQETGYMMAIEVLVEGQSLASERVANAGLAGRATESCRGLGSSNGSRGKERIEMTKSPNTATIFVDIGEARASRISLALAVSVGVLPVCTKARPTFALVIDRRRPRTGRHQSRTVWRP
jgi:hypothetical protein